MAELIDTTEMYLRTLHELAEEGVVPMRARIVERLGQSGPTVSQTVARMERDGLLVVSDDRIVHLTPDGERRAVEVMRRHRLAEALLVDTLGLGLTEAHDEACRWEHAMTDRVAERIDDFLGHPAQSPYGNPIPAAEAAEPALDERKSLRSALGAAAGRPVRATLLGISEAVQADAAALARLVEAGLRPGLPVDAAVDATGATTVATDGGQPVTVDAETAAGLYLDL